MGDLPVSALVNDVVGRLTSEFIKEFSLFRGFKADVLTLKNHFDLIQAVLQDAEKKRSDDDMAVELWLQRLKSISLKVENVLDEISTEALLRRLRKERGIKYRVKDFFSSEHNRFMFRVRSAHKVRAIRRKLDELESERSKLSLSTTITPSNVDDTGVAVYMPNRETSSLIEASVVIFGRNEDMEMITGKICNKDLGKCANGEILVYGIWGMGGIGKTTLAQLVYNHDRVKQHFDKKCWAFVSENFQAKGILKAIIESLDDKECKLTSLDVLQRSLQRKLKGKKFLIVLDDVWIEDENKEWEDLRKTLSCCAEGSIVLMTTRSQKTSQVLVKVPELQHKLGCLSEDDSWSLFKKLAFADGRVRDDISELESIGREIVEKCQGLPLAVNALGRLMWSKTSTSEWQHVKSSDIWELKKSKVLPALKLSYDNLRPHLKRCFAYCCMFPKGYEMEKDGVIELWIANGFIPPRGDIDLYKLGEEIFDCLLWGSFFQFHKKYLHKNTYKMHDLMNDMARHVMGNDCIIIEPACKDVKIPNEVLHLSSSSDEMCPLTAEDLKNLTSLRSIFMFRDVGYKYLRVIIEIFNQVYVYLRVLHLIGVKFQRLPESLFLKLKHLKYLNFSDSDIEVLPESIIYLQNLLVLVLHHCLRLCKLPKGLKYMKSLKYLGNKSCLSLKHLPLGIKELTGLQRLSTFPVGKESGAKIGELGDLNLLEGELVIEGLENVGGKNEAQSANIKCKEKLSALKLRWSISETGMGKEILQGEREKNKEVDQVLEGLEPNPSLKKLKIFHYTGETISPSWMLKLTDLVELIFYKCEKCERIPPLGRLPNLRVIKLQKMNSLKCFHGDDTNTLRDTGTNMFLSLEELNISRCQSLISLPSYLPKLRVLKLKGCSKLVSLPDEILKDLDELNIRHCVHLIERCEKENGVDWPKISHIPSIQIDLPSDAETEDEEGQEIMETLRHLANHFTKDDDGEGTHEEGEGIIDAETEDDDDGEETHEEGEEIIDAETEDKEAKKIMEMLRRMGNDRTNDDDGEETHEEGE